MGRKPKYTTYEEILKIKKDRANEYYRLNKTEINKRRREKYAKLKNESLNL